MNKLLLTVATFVTINAGAQTKIPIDEASKHVGESVIICDKVYSARFLESSKTQPTLLNLGAAYPNNKLTILINPENRKNFTEKPEIFYVNKNVCVTGKVIDFKGKPEIIVNSPVELKVDETKQGIDKEPRK